jgi:hypothetical protein
VSGDSAAIAAEDMAHDVGFTKGHIEGYREGAREALTDAATALYADPSAERGTTKALNNAIYAAWLLDRANEVAR